ncbi:Protein of unknown function (DUF3111) [Brevibacillus sp. CF112]|nr:Protein of unknown function (DUF3111) [Brevibacillus sp. CF112]
MCSGTRLKKQLGDGFTDWLVQLLAGNKEDGQEAIAQLREIQQQDYIAPYQRKAIVDGLNYALRSRDFYDPQLFARVDDPKAKALIQKGVKQLNEVELYELNKRLLKSVLQDAVPAVEQWGDSDSTRLLEKMKAAGIARAWIGLPDWTAAYMKPAFIQQANDAGYLIATYDSYHSIHKEENPDWNTAIFADKSLYENATIEKKNGEKKGGFLQRGSHHWEWDSLKIKGEVGTRMLYELLYNVPPLYHLNSRVWEAHHENIRQHLQVWAPFHQKAVQRPMTDFAVLTADRLVQKAAYGDDLQVVVNFSEHDFRYENKLVKAKSALILDGSARCIRWDASASRRK